MSFISNWRYNRGRKQERKTARAMGVFWKQCPGCGHEFGGHEWEYLDVELRVLVTDYGNGDVTYEGLCPPCCYEGHGVTMDEALDDIEARHEANEIIVDLSDDELLG